MNFHLSRRKGFLLFLLPSFLAVIIAVLYFCLKNDFESLQVKYNNTLQRLEGDTDSKLKLLQAERIKRGLQDNVDSLPATKKDSTAPPRNIVDLENLNLERLKEKGLTDPVRDIVADLRKHTELIPYKGILGGKMGFYFENKIWVLTDEWVLAYFEDGHTGGYLVAKYIVAGAGKIQWRRLVAHRI